MRVVTILGLIGNLKDNAPLDESVLGPGRHGIRLCKAVFQIPRVVSFFGMKFAACQDAVPSFQITNLASGNNVFIAPTVYFGAQVSSHTTLDKLQVIELQSSRLGCSAVVNETFPSSLVVFERGECAFVDKVVFMPNNLERLLLSLLTHLMPSMRVQTDRSQFCEMPA
jgi:hypothetical protein